MIVLKCSRRSCCLLLAVLLLVQQNWNHPQIQYFCRAFSFSTVPILHHSAAKGRRSPFLASSSSLEHGITWRGHHSKDTARNAASSADECAIGDDDDVQECLSSTGCYKKNKASFLTISEVYVAEIERLEDQGGIPPFYKRQQQQQQAATGAAVLDDNNNNSTPSEKASDHDDHVRDPSGDNNGSNKNKSSTSSRNVIKYNKRRRSQHSASAAGNIEYSSLVSEQDLVLVDAVRKTGMHSISRAFHMAGPRKDLHFDPSIVKAAIVTCGGLCPGLNNVIRELVHSLYYLYGAEAVYGIMGGFNGFHKAEYQPILLTNELVENIHHDGGTILRSSRGGFDIDKILHFLEERGINQLYIIGGDGTHRGAYAISQACLERKLNIAVAGIPKTIDNDVDYIDRTFGFMSAVEAAQVGIRTAKTEAMCNIPNGIGIIKLMGRSAGFLTAFAALGSGDVDLVLVPEVPIVLEGPNGVLPFLRQRVLEQKYAVVVVAEGAGEELLGVSERVDASGNRQLPQIGEYMKDQIQEYFSKQGEEATIKYIDPSYTVRSVAANGADSLYCMQLAQNAVHGAMAGMTGFSVGLVNNQLVYLPIPIVVESSPRQMDPAGQTWERILTMTGQPNSIDKTKQQQRLVEVDQQVRRNQEGDEEEMDDDTTSGNAAKLRSSSVSGGRSVNTSSTSQQTQSDAGQEIDLNSLRLPEPGLR